MNLSKSKQFLRDILPQVSRTFALNIRVLNEIDYNFIGSTYLICRFIDTVEDSPILANNQKINILQEFARIFKTTCQSKDFLKIIDQCKNISHYPPENELMKRFDEVIFLFNSFPQIYHDISKDMIVEMALGMAEFTEKYSEQDRKILENMEELEKYCYYVAGTVGVILTRLFTLKINSKTKKKILNRFTNDFGLCLQMTNIVKDVNDDKKRGWSYVPQTVLEEAGVTVEAFYDGLKPQQIKSIQEILIRKIEIYIKNSLIYCQSIPIYLGKYRLFCLIPLFLSIKTVYFLKNRKSSQIHIKKISKKNLFSTIYIIYLIFPFNILIKIYFFLIKKTN